MENGIKHEVIEEGCLKAVKSTSDFGGPNMWELHVKDATGWFRSVQWMNVYNIQKFFKTSLPKYKKVNSNKYEKHFN